MNTLDHYGSLLHWGTSTWTYPEWRGIVYHKPYTTKSIKTESLAEYAAFKPFRTVGIDITFYAPTNPFVLEEYARHLPAGFKCVSKVWKELTVPKWSNPKRYDKKAGQVNPHFLDAELFKSAVLVVQETTFNQHTGPFVFEFGEMFPPVVPSLAFFLEKLEQFLVNWLHRLPRNLDLTLHP